MDDPVISINDIRKTGHCVAGVRRWCEANRIDFRRLVDHGLPASTLLATGDALAGAVVEKVKAARHG